VIKNVIASLDVAPANVSYTMQPVVQPATTKRVQRVEQPLASCKQTFTRLSNQLNNRFENRLYRVNGV